MKKARKTSAIKLALFLFCILVIGAALAATFYYVVYLVKYEQIYTDIIVTSRTQGFAIDRNDIRFGLMPPGGAIERSMQFQSDKKVYVEIKAIGNISQFVTESNDHFLLSPGEQKTVRLTAAIPNATAYGNYSGFIEVSFYRPWFR